MTGVFPFFVVDIIYVFGHNGCYDLQYTHYGFLLGARLETSHITLNSAALRFFMSRTGSH